MLQINRTKIAKPLSGPFSLESSLWSYAQFLISVQSFATVPPVTFKPVTVSSLSAGATAKESVRFSLPQGKPFLCNVLYAA